MKIQEIESKIESLLFASGNPIGLIQMSEILAVDVKTIKSITEQIGRRLEDEGSGIRLLKLEDKYQFVTAPENSECVKSLLDKRRNPILSQAAMEVLALIAYNQPVTRAYVEQVRGVDSAAVIHNLLDKELVEEKGKLDAPGRPLLYGTTANFLRVFGISSLAELPELPSIKSNESEEEEKTLA